MKRSELIEVLQSMQIDLTLCSDSLKHHAVSELDSVEQKITELSNNMFLLYQKLEDQAEKEKTK